VTPPDRRTQLVLCGLGGQGIIFLTRVLAEAAMTEGREILAAETRGMAQRGGAVESHVKLGGYRGSIVRQGRADGVVVLDASRWPAARTFLRPRGAGFVNAARQMDGAEVCDASRIAVEIGNGRGANLVLLGFAVGGAPALFPDQDALLDALERLSPASAHTPNLRAFQTGMASALGATS